MKIENNSRKFFAFIIISNAIFIFIVIQSITWLLYYNFENSGTKMINSLAEKNLEMTVNTVQKEFDSIESYCQYLFINKDVINLMYRNGNVKEQDELDSITFRLNASNSIISPYIYSIYIYNKQSEYIYCTDQTFSNETSLFYDKDIVNIIKQARITDFAPVLRSIPDPYHPNENLYVYSLILYDKYSNQKLSDAALVVNIKVEPFMKMLESVNYQKGSSYLVLSTDGMIINSTNKEELFKNILDDKNKGNIMKNIFGSSSFNFKIGKSIYQTNYQYSSALKWNFVYTTPYDILYNNIEIIKQRTLIICLIVLAIAILISYILSRNINIPIKNLINKTISYEKSKKDNFIFFRRDILANLFQDDANFESLSNCFKEYNINLNLNKNLVLVHAKIDHTSQLYEAYDVKERKLILFSVGNIICEILHDAFVAEIVESDKDFLDILMNVTTDKEMNDTLKCLLSKAQKEVFKHLNLSVSFTVSEQITTLQNLSKVYSKIIEFSNYRLMAGYSSIIFASEIEPVSRIFTYPFNNEKQLFDFLLLGKFPEAYAKYNEMVQNVVEYSCNDVIAFYTQLSLSFNSFINKLNSTANTRIDFNLYTFNMFLNKAETIEEINSKFELLFKEICDALEPNKEEKSKELISIINDYIEKNYHDSNFSLNTVADYIDKSPAYLGRLYRGLAGVSIPDYINELRLKKAMELLSGSNVKIEEICRSIGFPTEKYFYIFFKKHIGITPNEYRSRKPGSGVV